MGKSSLTLVLALALALTLTLILILTAACGSIEEPSEPLFKLDKGEVIQV